VAGAELVECLSEVGRAELAAVMGEDALESPAGGLELADATGELEVCAPVGVACTP
jgi:hypothetical protein